MSGVSEDTRAEYRYALQDFLAGAGEAALQRAYQLGRKAMTDGFGVLEVAAVHHEALMSVVQQGRPMEESGRMVKEAGAFLAESLSPFEITHRGYEEANLTLRHALEFVAVVCHELRTPLTSIQASTGLLQEILSPDPGGNVGRLLTNILDGASALNARMNDLVDMAGFQSGSLSIHEEAVEVGPLLRRICQRMEPVVRRAGLVLGVDVADDLPLIRADPLRLEQVVSNLIHNATKFGFEGERVELRAWGRGRQIVVEVQDYGKGISPGDLASLFQPFVRVGPDRQRVPGLGIGLALCKQLVRAHRGRIWVVSEVGKGTVFKFSLPLNRAAALSEEKV